MQGRILSEKNIGLRQWRQRPNALFQDREILIRSKNQSDGQVRHLKVSARIQGRLVFAAVAALLVWLGLTIFMVFSHVSGQHEEAALNQRVHETAKAEQRIAAYRSEVAELAEELDSRQAQLEEWQDAYFGNSVNLQGDDHAHDVTTGVDPNVSAEARDLIAVATRQNRLASQLLTAVNNRAIAAEAAVRKMGLNPDHILRQSDARGGPFLPYRAGSGKVKQLGSDFAALDRALYRMEILERSLVALPSGKPANVLSMSSGFGYRSDPFNGTGAMHAGLDFRGPIGTPILAAAPGRITFVGSKGGYGNVIEIEHGQGIMTRYAHLSGYTTKVGQKVAAGAQIGKMGSTGRSTGSHLHFEVRLNGAAVNPRRFLDVHQDILAVKDDAEQRVGPIAGRVI